MVTSRSVLLWGPPGSGKSTVGALVARALGLPFVDSDARLARAHGAPTAGALLRSLGEPSFRALERAAVRDALREFETEGPAVLALGGGALLDRALRIAALGSARVLALGAPVETLAARVCAQQGALDRPSLDEGPSGRSLEDALAALLAARADAYAEVHARVEASGDAHAVARRVVEALEDLAAHPTVVVPLGRRSYPVRFDALSSLPSRVRGLAPDAQTLLVLDRGARVAPGVNEAALALAPVRVEELPGRGDADKTLETLARVWDAALGAGLDRDALLVALGGGVTTDLTGFAASTLLRGVRFVSAPTTLLAMADASVGGKTGIDHPRGKNLLGSVHQPSLVLCDPRVLATVTPRELRSGLAEIAKVALACDPELCARLALDAARLRALDLDALAAVLPAAVWAKARVVALDEHERGSRASLNFGHTVGHAVEHASGYAVPHGECVALGMRAAIALGARLGVTPAPAAREALVLLDALGLAAELPEDARVVLDRPLAVRALEADKKRRGGALRFVLLTGLGASTLAAVGADAARGALDDVR